MDSSGNIHRLRDEADLRRELQSRKLIPIPPEELARLKKANKEARRKWFAREVAQLDQSPEAVAERCAERRRARNKRKAQKRRRA